MEPLLASLSSLLLQPPTILLKTWNDRDGEEAASSSGGAGLDLLGLFLPRPLQPVLEPQQLAGQQQQQQLGDQQQQRRRRRWPFRRRRRVISPLEQQQQQHQAFAPPCTLCMDGRGCQQLIATGRAVLGTPALNLGKLYDFSIHASAKQAAGGALAAELAASGGGLPPGRDLVHRLCRSHDFEATLTVQATRNLPVALLSREYQRILRRRIKKVGGAPNDPALLQLVDALRLDRLPASIRQGGSVRKGARIVFTMAPDGTVTASAGGQQLVCVRSVNLAAAVKELYLGSHPVDRRAAAAAVATLGSWMAGGPRGQALLRGSSSGGSSDDAEAAGSGACAIGSIRRFMSPL